MALSWPIGQMLLLSYLSFIKLKILQYFFSKNVFYISVISLSRITIVSGHMIINIMDIIIYIPLRHRPGDGRYCNVPHPSVCPSRLVFAL